MIGLRFLLSRDPVARSSRLRHDEIWNQHLTFRLWA
jgi:hypothetical protein